MLFNSIEFIIFALLFFLLWPIFNRKNSTRWGFLVNMSFIFYGWWDWRFLFLIIGSGILDYWCGLAIQNSTTRKRTFLILSLLGNLGSLAIFKYSEFFAENLDTLFHTIGIETALKTNLPEFTLILPVGISFYTFQSMSYTIDVYRGRLKPTKNILHFFSYLVMFPQLVAGPIIRAKDLLKQLTEQRKSIAIQKWHAIKLIVFGLFQKTVIADNIAYLIDSAYQNKSTYDGSAFWWIVIIGFAMQIYCDFSGYSLMARGLAKWMGFHFKMNFNHPYHSTSIRSFWSHWHISLSTWFRDYVYIPMGGSKKGVSKGILFMAITMLISGLWHGAAFTFLAWGLCHAIFLGFERLTNWSKKLNRFRFGKTIALWLVLFQVAFAWNYFRADTIREANIITGKLFSFDFDWSFIPFYRDQLIFLLLGVVIEIAIYLRKRHQSIGQYYKRLNIDVPLTAFTLMMCVFFRGPETAFIYFQF